MTVLIETVIPGYTFGERLALPAVQEERRDLFDTVVRDLRCGEFASDPDRRGACWYLLRHLARTAPFGTASGY